MMRLNLTDGMHSRTRKIDANQARRIIREYRKGKRGKARAHVFGITAVQYNNIGSRRGWRCLTEGTNE